MLIRFVCDLEQEAKEAEELVAELSNGGGLAALIQARQAQRGSDVISRLEAKYSAIDEADDYV